MQANQINETLVGIGGQFSAAIATGNAATTLKTGIGRLCRISITVAGTVGFTVYDNIAASGTVLFASPATTAIGTVYDIQMPAQLGITVQNVVNGPAMTVSFN